MNTELSFLECRLYKFSPFFRIGKEPPGTTQDKILTAKKLYEGAFHPDTGDLQNLFGRMSFQVPGGMAVTGAMLTFYRSAYFLYCDTCILMYV